MHNLAEESMLKHGNVDITSPHAFDWLVVHMTDAATRAGPLESTTFRLALAEGMLTVRTGPGSSVMLSTSYTESGRKSVAASVTLDGQNMTEGLIAEAARDLLNVVKNEVVRRYSHLPSR